MRMHFVVFSILANVPFVAIAYERKSMELCEQLGLEEFCHDAASIDAARAIETIRQALARQVDVRRQLADRLETLRLKSVRSAEHVVRIASHG
jgi:polysaccharide pyruvyl transferase WcaK-like protein